MRVVFFDIVAKLPMGNNRSMSKLDDVLAVSDFVTLHVPETAQTRNMIGPAQIAQMKPGACLLNASRGTVVEIAALADGIRRGHIGGAAVDVYPDEPESNSSGFTSELRGLPNVILTPHIGGSTEEAQEAIGREVSAALIKYINTGATTGAVNFPQIELPLDKTAHRILNVHKNVPRRAPRHHQDRLGLERERARAGAVDRPRHRLPPDGSRSGRLRRRQEGGRRAATSIKTRILF